MRNIVVSGASRLVVLAIGCSGLALVQAPLPQAGSVSGTVTIDAIPVTLAHAIRTTRPNLFNEFFNDTVVLLSDRAVTAEEAADDAGLYARAARGELVTVAGTDSTAGPSAASCSTSRSITRD